MHLPSAHLDEIFQFTMSPIELVVRGTAMYWFLLLIFRFVLRRDVGSVGLTDFLFVVILGDASQNAMIGDATSTADGMTLIATLVFWNFFLDWLSFRSPLVARFLSASRLCLVRDGKMLRRQMRREFITTQELEAKLREDGIEDIADVKAMFLESDGEISIIKRQ